jgi:oligopeptide transport system substrate-binding protein
MRPALLFLLPTLSAVACSGCTNNPYPRADDRSKVIYEPFVEAPRTLDPAQAYTTSAHRITSEVYGTLLEYHYLERPYRLIPGLTEEVPRPEPLPDGRVAYAFRLREGLLYGKDPCFTLGGRGRRTRSINASDVAFEIMRIADPEVDSPVPEPFSNIDGFREFTKRLLELRKKRSSFSRLPAHRQYAAAGPMKGLQVEGDRGLRVVLSEPYPQILYWFAMPFTSPLPWEAVQYYDGKQDRERLDDHPVSSGPYVLAEYDKQARIVLQLNPNWYGARSPGPEGTVYPAEGEEEDRAAGRLDPAYAGKPLPFIERIEIRREKERIPAFSKFLQGYYDVSGVLRESFDKVIHEGGLSREMKQMGMQLDKSVVPAVYYLGFNMQDAVVGEPGGERGRKLRQAMSLVIDAAEYARLFMNGRGVPAQSLLPPGIFGYEADYRNPFRSVDVKKAQRILRQAGYPDGIDPKTGKPLHLTFDTGNTSPEALLRVRFFVNAWRRIGLDVEIAATNYNRFQEKMRQGAYQVFSWGWVADYPDPENFMFLLWSRMARSVHGGPNSANFMNPRYDELFLQMKTRDNDEKRLAIIREMRALLEKERPWIELFYPEDYVLLHAWMRNVKVAGLSLPSVKYQDIDPALRSGLRAEWNRPIVWPAYLLLLLAVLLIAPGVRAFLRERQ